MDGDSLMIYKKNSAVVIEKHGVTMHIYPSTDDCPQAAVVYQETATGHAEEFYHEKSAFIYYIIEGRGTWVIEDIEYPVEAGDVVIVPPRRRFYFTGTLKQICVTAPAWEEHYEKHIRYVDL